jgi:hypothetical protein
MINAGPHIMVVSARSPASIGFEWFRNGGPDDVRLRQVSSAKADAKGKRATSHRVGRWLAKEFPETEWVRGVRFVEEGNIATGGGLTAGIDLALHVVERYFGRPAAQDVAQHLEYECTGWMQ